MGTVSAKGKRGRLGGAVVALCTTLCMALPVVASGCKRPIVLPTEEVPESAVTRLARTPAERKPSPGQTRVLGTGWYANVEVDNGGTVHVAWTDADLGDVLYTTVPAGKTEAEVPEPVEVKGAVGSYLRLALAPGDVPVLSYYHQDRRMLRLAHRPADLARLKEQGGALDTPAQETERHTVLVPGEKPPPDPSDGMGEGWHGEDVAFGDNVGMAGGLVVDKEGRAHLTYYTKNERFRYARRPKDKDAFGPHVAGIFDKLDVDERAGGSYTMSTDLAVLGDGTAVVSYCHWNYIDSQLRLGVLAPSASSFTIVEAAPMLRMVDGWHSTLLPKEGSLEVFSVATGEMKLFSGPFDPKTPAPLAARDVLMERPGPAVVRRGPDGTLWVLTRGQGYRTLGEEPGVWLVEVPGGDPAKARRLLLERGLSRDPWIDLAIRPDGRPVAVWTSRETQSMKMYAP